MPDGGCVARRTGLDAAAHKGGADVPVTARRDADGREPPGRSWKVIGMALLLVIAAGFSVVYDLHTYEERLKSERLTHGGHR